MKKLLTWGFLLLPLFLAAKSTENYPVPFPDTILVGVDTLWSYPVMIAFNPIENQVTGRTFKLHCWSNDTCVLDVYFSCLDNYTSLADTSSMDSLQWMPWGAPGDSTVWEDYIVPTTAATYAGMIYPDVCRYVRFKLILAGETTDTVWIGHTIKDHLPRYAWISIGF